MGQVIYQRFFSPQMLSTVPALIYQLSASPTSLISRGWRVRLSNVSNASTSVTLYNVPNGASPQLQNEIVNAGPVPANSYVDIDIPIMGPGDALWASSGINAALVLHLLNGILYQ